MDVNNLVCLETVDRDCKAINPANPRAVADAIPQMYEALKLWLGNDTTTPELYEEAVKAGRKALAKAEGRNDQ